VRTKSISIARNLEVQSVLLKSTKQQLNMTNITIAAFRKVIGFLEDSRRRFSLCQ